MDLLEQIRVFTYVGYLFLLFVTIGIISFKAKKREEFPLDETIEVILYNLFAFLVLLGLNFLIGTIDDSGSFAIFILFYSWFYIIPFAQQIVGIYTALIIPTDQKIKEKEVSETSSSNPPKSNLSRAFEFGLIAFLFFVIGLLLKAYAHLWPRQVDDSIWFQITYTLTRAIWIITLIIGSVNLYEGRMEPKRSSTNLSLVLYSVMFIYLLYFYFIQ